MNVGCGRHQQELEMVLRFVIGKMKSFWVYVRIDFCFFLWLRGILTNLFSTFTSFSDDVVDPLLPW